MKYELHPACAMWPQMEDHELEALADDIRVNGQTHPIILLGNKVLDGRNRMLACELVGIEPLTTSYNGNDPVAYAVSANLHRRHLNTSQRAMIGAEIENMRQGDNRYTNRHAKSHVYHSRIDAANLMNVSPRTIAAAKSIVANGTLEQITAIKSGKATVGKGLTKASAKSAPVRKSKRPPATYPKKWVPLTREQVDPEFEGTEMEWTMKYGHVQAMTAEQYATDRFNAWSWNLVALVKLAKNAPSMANTNTPAWPVVDLNWLRSPKPGDIARMAEALNYLRPIIAEAEAMLAKAVAVLAVPEEVAP